MASVTASATTAPLLVGGRLRREEGSKQLAIPPQPGAVALVRSAEAIPIVLRPHMARWRVRKWIAGHEREYLRVAPHDRADEIDEPAARRTRRHRLEPHQPAEPQVIGGDL